MEIFLMWFIGTIIVAVVASNRGRSGFGWLVLSLFISPLLSFLLLAMLPNPRKLALEQKRHEEFLIALASKKQE